MIKIALIGIVAVLLSTYFKNIKPEYGAYIGIASCILIFYFGSSKLELIIEAIHKIQSYLSIDTKYISTLIKIVGITYVADISSNLCKDAGHAAIASQIELVGKLTILAISMPILLALLDTVNGFLKA